MDKPKDGEAKRFNDTKVDLTLLPEVACYEEAKVWMFGEKKYGRSNWEKLWGEETVNVATASLLRHAFALASGELLDRESGLPHAAHIRCNSAMILQHMANEHMIHHTVYHPRPQLPKANAKKKAKEFHLSKVKVSYTKYSRMAGNTEIGYTEYAIIPKISLQSFKESHANVQVLGETSEGLDGTYYIGGSL